MAAILSRPQCVKRYHHTYHKFTTRKLQLHENVVKELAKSCSLFIYIGIPYSSNCYSDTRFLLLQRFGPMHIFKFLRFILFIDNNGKAIISQSAFKVEKVYYAHPSKFCIMILIPIWKIPSGFFY